MDAGQAQAFESLAARVWGTPVEAQKYCFREPATLKVPLISGICQGLGFGV